MENRTKVLYVSYDGMTDPLGQSQVIPYLDGLSKHGFEIHLLSCEKQERFKTGFSHIEEVLKQSNIIWHPISYTSSPKVVSTIKDIIVLIRTATNLNKEHHFTLTHCRSYIASFVGLNLKRKEKVPFVFDMRGFWADERFDGEIWNKKNPLFLMIYKYFKKKEKQFLNQADSVVTLTERAKSEILNNFGLKQKPDISVIPCCVDNVHFSQENISLESKNAWSEKLKINPDDFIISYSGSVGTWYMLEEMLDLFKVMSEYYANAKFLFITLDDSQPIISKCKNKNIDLHKIIICKGNRTDMQVLLSLSTVSLFFIKPVYSKMASSPTKMAELLSLGIPIITNSGVGDIDELAKENQSILLIKNLTESSYHDAMPKIPSLLETKTVSNNIPISNYSLEYGVKQYNDIYCKLKNINQA